MRRALAALDPQPPGFGYCPTCPYLRSGTAEICYSCARQTIDPVRESACKVCSHPVASKETCRNHICNWNPDERYFEKCHAIALKRARGTLEKAIHKYKYDGIRGFAILLGRILAGHLDEHRSTFESLDLIVASPTFVSPDGGRAWDHTRLVLQQADSAAPSRWPFDVVAGPAIIKTSATTSMAGKKWKERRTIAEGELRGALSVPDPSRTRGKKILVYDDVFTEGFTLREVARCLMLQGEGDSVSGIVLARQPWGSRS